MSAHAAVAYGEVVPARGWYPGCSTELMAGASLSPALYGFIGSHVSIEDKQDLARREGLLTPTSFEISATSRDPNKGGDEPFAFFDFLHDARCPAEGVLPSPLRFENP